MITKVDIKDFLPYGNVSVDIPNGLGLLLGETDKGGSNGAGKSGLIEAITWGLWGTARSTDVYPAGDMLVRRGTSKAEVGIEVKSARSGVVLRVDRSRSLSGKGTTKLDAKLSTPYLFDKKKDEVQKQIIELLGMDFNIFKHTYFIKPNESSNFSLLPPSEAKAMVMKILNLSKWERYHEVAKNKLADIERDITDVEIVIRTLTGQIDGVFPERIKDEIIYIDTQLTEQNEEDVKLNTLVDKMVKTIESLNEKLYEAKNNLSSKEDQLIELSKQKGSTRDEVDRIRISIKKTKSSITNRNSDISRLELEIKEMEDKIFAISREYVDINEEGLGKEIILSEKHIFDLGEEIATLRAQIKNNSARIKVLSTGDGIGICPILEETCDRVDPSAILPAITELEDENKELGIKLDKYVNDKFKEEEILKKSKEEINRLKDARNNVTILTSKVESSKEAILNNKDLLIDLEETLETSNKLLLETEQKLTKIESEIAEIDIETLRKLKEEVNNISTQLEIERNNNIVYTEKKELIHNNIISLKSDKAVKEAKLEEIKETVTQISLRKDELSGLQNMSVVHKQVVDVFSKDGIPLHIIDISAATIENIANNILVEIGKSISIKIKVESTTKKQKVKDTFEIVVVQDGQEILYKMYSGGESFWIDFALRIAMAIVERNISGSMMNTFIIDEGIGRLDHIERELFVKTLRYVISEHGVEQILLVTHTDISESQRTIFDFVITAKKICGVSSLECSHN